MIRIYDEVEINADDLCDFDDLMLIDDARIPLDVHTRKDLEFYIATLLHCEALIHSGIDEIKPFRELESFKSHDSRYVIPGLRVKINGSTYYINITK